MEERRERENMASRHSEAFGAWKVREQELTEQLDRLNGKAGEQKLAEEKYREEIQNLREELSHLTQSSEQAERELAAKLEEAIVLKEEMDEKCAFLKKEKERVSELYGDQKIRYEEKLEELEKGVLVQTMEELDLTKVEKRNAEDLVRHMEEEKCRVEAELLTSNQQLEHFETQAQQLEEEAKVLRESVASQQEIIANLQAQVVSWMCMHVQ